MAKKNIMAKKGKNCILKNTVVLSIIFGIIAGGLTSFLILNFSTPSTHTLMKEFYQMENNVIVSPYDYFREAAKPGNNLLLVDLRTSAEYNVSHVKGAINIPATQLTETQLVQAFRKLPKNKTIIVHCYSSTCMLASQVGGALAEHNIFVKHLDVGWAELSTQFASHIVNGTGANNGVNSTLLSNSTNVINSSCSNNKGFSC